MLTMMMKQVAAVQAPSIPRSAQVVRARVKGTKNPNAMMAMRIMGHLVSPAPRLMPAK